MNILVWLIVALFFLLLEIGHPGLFFFLSFSIAAGCSAILAYFEFSLGAQCAVFIISCLADFFLLRFIAKRIVHHVPRTNMYALEGKKAVVIAPITAFRAGQVKVNGEIWMARSSDDSSIDEGSTVQVLRVQGAHLVVQKM